MSFVIYRTDTTQIVSEKRYTWSGQIHKTEGHAKASLTRIKKKFAEGYKNQKPHQGFRFEDLGTRDNGDNDYRSQGKLTGGLVEMKIVDYDTYKKSIEAQVERTHFMTGKKFKESVNTPHFCSPSSETYFSM
jgi:hypothetical protein